MRENHRLSESRQHGTVQADSLKGHFMKIGIAGIVLVAVVTGALWMTGLIGGPAVLGTSWLDGRAERFPDVDAVGATVAIVIGEGGVPEGLEPGAEVTIGALDTGAAFCRAVIVRAIDTPDGPGYTAECTEQLY
jgi:hypothetical protein